MFGFLSLAYFAQHNDLYFHSSSANDIISFFSWLTNTPLHIFHIFFIYLLIPQLGYCDKYRSKHAFAGVSSMLIDTPSDICPRVV
jgi:hypothetical protein